MDIPVDIYIDVGSPFRHFYIVDKREHEHHTEYTVAGISIKHDSDFSIIISIAPQHWKPKYWKKIYEGDEIHIVIGDSVPLEIRMLIDKAAYLHNLKYNK
jgi:hypothetical protein